MPLKPINTKARIDKLKKSKRVDGQKLNLISKTMPGGPISMPETSSKADGQKLIL